MAGVDVEAGDITAAADEGTAADAGIAAQERARRKPEISGSLTARRCWRVQAAAQPSTVELMRRTVPLYPAIFRRPLMHMVPVARVCHQMLRLGRGSG